MPPQEKFEDSSEILNTDTGTYMNDISADKYMVRS